MGTIIAGLAVFTMLLVASGIMFSTFLDTSVSSAQSFKDLTQTKVKRVGSGLGITSAVFDGSGTADLSVNVDNTGSQSVIQFAEMDIIIKYTDTSDNQTLTHLSIKLLPSGTISGRFPQQVYNLTFSIRGFGIPTKAWLSTSRWIRKSSRAPLLLLW